MLRVLIADDSKISASLIARILSEDSEIEIAGIARDGREAVQMTVSLEPDVITMDIHMPVMNGFEATKEIMIQKPTPIVIVSASTAVSETEWGMCALRAGALTLLLKPPGPGTRDFSEAAKELVETVKSMAEVKVVRHTRRPPASTDAALSPAVTRRTTGCRAVAIAASTGGPPALQLVLGALPANFPVPILLVQHMPGNFVAGFAEWLNSTVPLAVQLAEQGIRMEPGHVYVAPQDRHLGVQRTNRVVLSDEPAIGGFRPSASFLFDSVACAPEEQTLAVILTGMGSDGLEGLRTVRAKFGTTIAQDKESCVVFGMPGVAVAEGLADTVTPVEAIAKVILKFVSQQNA